MDCIFCKIINKEIPATVVYEDDEILAFRDINPCAPEHILFIPKEHIKSANEINEKNVKIISKIFLKIPEVARTLGFATDGYRIINNCGDNGGQDVYHIHFHLVAGRQMMWPPG